MDGWMDGQMAGCWVVHREWPEEEEVWLLEFNLNW